MSRKGFTNDAIPALSLVESPIEGKFVQSFFDLMREQGFTHSYRNEERSAFSVIFKNSEQFPNFSYKLVSQAQFEDPNIGRVDFLVAAYTGDEGELCAVELDGAEFHSSPDAQKRDRIKDRRFIELDSFCLRYAGKEVFASARKCVDEVITILREKIDAKEASSRFSFESGIEVGIKKASNMTAIELALKVKEFAPYEYNEQEE